MMFRPSDVATFDYQKKLFAGMSSRDALAAVKNMHAGRRAFVLGNGPSLQIKDLDPLRDEITFAANRIYLAYDQTDWRPTYWCCSDKLVAETNAARIATLQHIKFGAFSVEQALANTPHIYFVADSQRERDMRAPRANVDLLSGVHPGVSVVMFMLKLAYWMGVDMVYLIGIDFDFVVPNTATGKQEFGNPVIVSTGEVNHFHPDYRKPGETWTMPLLDEQRAEFAQMRWKFESEGRVIYNASRKTKLGVFERVSLDDILPER